MPNWKKNWKWQEQSTRPSAQEFQRIKEERDTAHEERDRTQQNLDELRAELDEMDELLANKNSQIGDLVKERDSRPTNQQWTQNQQKLIKIIAEAKKWKTKYTNSEWEIKYNELLQISFDLTEDNEKLKEEHEKELEKLKNQENTPQKNLNEEQKEVDLLRETSETLKKENQVLKEIIASLKSDNPQNLIQNQQIIERLEERLVNCCSECLVGKEEQEEGLNKAKKEIFQLCERLDVTLPEWLEEKIKSAATYKQLVKSLSDIHDRRAIIEIQKTQAKKTGQVLGETFTSTEPRKEINPGVKQFLWITGILALISSILAIVKKWRSSKLRKK